MDEAVEWFYPWCNTRQLRRKAIHFTCHRSSTIWNKHAAPNQGAEVVLGPACPLWSSHQKNPEINKVELCRSYQWIHQNSCKNGCGQYIYSSSSWCSWHGYWLDAWYHQMYKNPQIRTMSILVHNFNTMHTMHTVFFCLIIWRAVIIIGHGPWKLPLA